MTLYLKVIWRHESPDEPVIIYSEVGDDGYETRKIHMFLDGGMEWAEGHREGERTALGTVPVPTVEEIAAHREFMPSVIDREFFEYAWRIAQRAGASHG